MTITVAERGRVDKILADALPQYSRAALHKLFAMDLVQLDGETVRPGHKCRIDAVIDADISPLDQDQQVVELPIIYEDDNVVVINKPTGIISHARGQFWFEPSVASFLRWHTTKGVGGGVEGTVIPNSTHTPDGMVTKSYPLDTEPTTVVSDRAGIVHRLDRATSGVMICAKNEDTQRFLQKQFADRRVSKTYIAILEKTPDKPEAIIDAPIERNPKNPSQFRVGPNGKSAQTHYKILDPEEYRSKNIEYRITSKQQFSGCMVEFTPSTGRTHQLRVHSLYIKCPIVGDDFYGTKAERLYLHAHTLTLNLLGGETKTFTAPLPKEFVL
jgi:23S rRNA pseudouridine1911/1915/1917 synthase